MEETTKTQEAEVTTEETTQKEETKTEKTFTQAELDELIKTRLARATKDMPSKEEQTAYKKWQEEQKTEQQKNIDLQLSIEATLKKANDRLISAELKSLDGYDIKLVDRLIDKSKIIVDEDGNVAGIKEALANLEAEFPQVKKAITTTAVNPPLKGASTPQTDYEELLKQAQKDPANSGLQRQLFAAKEKLRKRD